jgi:two-component system sensor histidine kinase UhpB
MNLIFSKARVLVVEDEKIIAKDIESTLKRIGHESAGSVARGEDAIIAAEKEKPDMVLMDITLKGEMDGIEAAKIINDRFNIPIVYITAHQDEDTIEKTKGTNPYGYITKPLDDRDLSTAINSAMYRRDVELKLKDAEEKYFRLSENAPDMIFSQNLETRVYNYVNNSATKLTGYAPKEYYDKPGLLENIVDPEWKEQYLFTLKMIKSSNTTIPFEYMITNKNGGKIWINQRSVVLRNAKNEAVSIEAILTDVTERKNYEEKLEETTLKLRALSNYQQRIREEERLYISREIHDQLGQDLTVLKMDLSMISKNAAKQTDNTPNDKINVFIDELKKTTSYIDEIINKVRKIATELRPDILDKLGLSEAIEWHAGEFEKRSNIKCITKLCEEEPVLSPEKSISVFRIFQETLTNTARHSGATEVKIELNIINGWMILSIHDNGRGITPSEIEKGTSLGILGMKERVLILGGIWNINGEKDKGTTVQIKVPLN